MADEIISKIGVVGLGKMGLPIACHLARGFSVMGYDRRDEPFARFLAAGGRRARSAAEVASGSDLVIVVVGFESQVDETLFASGGLIEGARDGLVVAIASTVPASYVKALPSRAKPKAIDFIDIPLTRAEQAAENGNLLVLGGGERSVFDRCRLAFSTFASDIAYLGALGAGQTGKMINNMILWTCTSANYEGFKLAKSLGIDPEDLRRALQISTAQNWAMSSRADERSAPWAEKDMMIVLKEADLARVSLPLAGVVKEVIKGFKIEHGHVMPNEED
jgi:3-hydroxyisobutyrate dehydrogenase-like beta-hydroxyacid dehydrogenase